VSQATIRIPTPLRGFTGGASDVSIRGATVREALASLERAHRGATSRVLDEHGELRSFVSVFVDSRNVKQLGGLDTPLSDGAVVTIVPAVAGGAGGRR
jgi:molybdopterin converting factor small subunit